MTDHDQPQRGGTSSTESAAESSAGGSSTVPNGSMLANPRRVRRP